MKALLSYLIIALVSTASLAQSIDLMEAYTKMEAHYPALQQSNILIRQHDLETQKIKTSRYPSIALKADGRLQSEAPKLDLPEGLNFPINIDLPLYSLKAYGEIQYQVLDGGVSKAKQKQLTAKHLAALQDVDVTKFSLREKINQLFVSILQIREQERLFDISLDNLNSRIESVKAGVDEGVILESQLTILQVKQYEIQAEKDDLYYKELSLVNTLSYFIGEKLDVNTNLILPELGDPKIIPQLNRPESGKFQAQRQATSAVSDLIDARRNPKLMAFAQGGIGHPNPLNFLENETAPYGLVGLQFIWPLSGRKQDRIDRELLTVQSDMISTAENTFEYNLNAANSKYLTEIERINLQVESSQEVATMQKQLLDQMAVMLDEGTITTSDYTDQLNKELLARQKVVILQTQLQNTQLDFWNLRGGF